MSQKTGSLTVTRKGQLTLGIDVEVLIEADTNVLVRCCCGDPRCVGKSVQPIQHPVEAGKQEVPMAQGRR
jgi:hypothetical protein